MIASQGGTRSVIVARVAQIDVQIALDQIGPPDEMDQEDPEDGGQGNGRIVAPMGQVTQAVEVAQGRHQQEQGKQTEQAGG